MTKHHEKPTTRTTRDGWTARLVARVGTAIDDAKTAAAARVPSRVRTELGRASAWWDTTWDRVRRQLPGPLARLFGVAPEDDTSEKREHAPHGAESRAAAFAHARRPHVAQVTPDGVRNVVLRRVHRHV